MIRIFVADEQAVVREGVKRITGETSDLFVAGEAATNTEMLSQLSGRPCDVVLMDISLTGRGGLDILQELKTQYPQLPVLVFSSWTSSRS